jgi:hypothetical protein
MSSTKAIKDSLGKDNSILDSFLIKKGFYISTNSKSNYNRTIFSISTTFNMEYLVENNKTDINNPLNFFSASASIIDNSLTRILKNENYKISQFQPISFQNSNNSNHPFFEDMLTYHYFYKTLPGRVYRDLFWNIYKLKIKYLSDHQKEVVIKKNKRRQYEIESTKENIKATCNDTTKPKFVYGHFMIPHSPYIFDSAGNIKQKKEYLHIKLNQKSETEQYLEQVKYANRIIIDLVEHIQKRNKKNTIIIIAGDHGPFHTCSNLNAIYFPDSNYNMIYNSISNINIFRVLLNREFGTSLPLLKDSSIYMYQKNIN